MIVQKDFLNKLRDFGLNSYEAKLWTALLSRGVATAGELSDISNVPRSRSYDVLESLERKGFVMMKLGKPIKYLAIAPSEVIERVKKRIKENAENQSTMIENLKNSAVLNELNLLHKNSISFIDPLEYTGVLKGRHNIYSMLSSSIKNASKSVLISTSEDGLLRKSESLKSALQKAKSKGIKVHFTAPLTSKNKLSLKLLSDFNVKHSNHPLRFAVVDGKQTFIMALDDSSVHPNFDFAIWVDSAHFAGTFEKFFGLISK